MQNKSITLDLAGQEIVITRTFDAPRELVFKAFTDPQLLSQWWGPRYLTTHVDIMEPKPGGRWRYVQRAPDGGEHAFHGVYHTVSAPAQLVFTFEYEGMPGHVLLETVTFEELPGGKTRIIDQAVYQSVADRDGMLASGMESGAAESMDRLAELLS